MAAKSRYQFTYRYLLYFHISPKPSWWGFGDLEFIVRHRSVYPCFFSLFSTFKQEMLNLDISLNFHILITDVYSNLRCLHQKN